MTLNSRLQSHRREASPGLFHTAYGSVSPISLQLTLADPVADDSAAAAKLMGAMLHERHHWLQNIGTPAGMFHYLILERQAILIQAVLAREKQLSVDDMPLCEGRLKDTLELKLWDHLELVRRMLWGARRGDISVLQEHLGAANFEEVSAQIGQLLLVAVEGADGARSHLDLMLEIAGGTAASGPILFDSGGWGLGARHLMEDAARTSEVARLIAYGSHGDEPLATISDLVVGKYFTGMYGKAKSLFYPRLARLYPSGTGTRATELAFEYLCDVSLRGAYPPFAPAAGGFLSADWNPGAQFAFMLRHLAGFDLHQRVELFDPVDVRGFLADLHAHLNEQTDGFLDASDALAEHTAVSALGTLNSMQVADSLFELRENWPFAKSWHGRLSYMLSLSKEALRIRSENPELFVFPACHYVADRQKFHELYDPIASPLVRYPNTGEKSGGIGPSPGKPEGWMEYFICDAIMYDLLRGMVMQTPDQLVEMVYPYIHTLHGTKSGLSLAEASLNLFFKSRPIGNYIKSRPIGNYVMQGLRRLAADRPYPERSAS